MKSLSRHPSLVPFSRDHHYALVAAMKLRKSEEQDMEAKYASLSAFVEEWHNQMEDHFGQEERLLIPLMTEAESTKLLHEHAQLGQLCVAASNHLQEKVVPEGFVTVLGTLLHDHVRWEERELYESIQKRADNANLNRLLLEVEKINKPPLR